MIQCFEIYIIMHKIINEFKKNQFIFYIQEKLANKIINDILYIEIIHDYRKKNKINNALLIDNEMSDILDHILMRIKLKKSELN